MDLKGPGRDATVVGLTDLVTDAGSKAQRLQVIDRCQAQLDTRQLLSSLPEADPDRTVNPDRPDLFWGDADGKTPAPAEPGDRWLIGRGYVITDAAWEGDHWNLTRSKVR